MMIFLSFQTVHPSYAYTLLISREYMYVYTYIFKIVLCLCTHMCAIVHARMEVRRKFVVVVFSFHYVGPGHRIQIIRLGSKSSSNFACMHMVHIHTLFILLPIFFSKNETQTSLNYLCSQLASLLHIRGCYSSVLQFFIK